MTLISCPHCAEYVPNSNPCEKCGKDLTTQFAVTVPFAWPIAPTPDAVGAEIRRLLLTLRHPDHIGDSGHYGTDELRAKALDLAGICWNGSGKMHDPGAAELACAGRPARLDQWAAR